MHAFIPADLDALSALGANGPVLASLRAAASPQSGRHAPPWIVGGFAVSTHPDLVVHMFAIADALRTEVRFVYGRPAILGATGIIRAFGLGMRDLAVRVPVRSPVPLAARPRPDLGPEWHVVPAWNPGVPSTAQAARLAAILEAVSRA